MRVGGGFLENLRSEFRETIKRGESPHGEIAGHQIKVLQLRPATKNKQLKARKKQNLLEREVQIDSQKEVVKEQESSQTINKNRAANAKGVKKENGKGQRTRQ